MLSTPDEKGLHAVTAGGRRLWALQELAAEGVVPADYKVPCLVEELEEALETSLMENTVRAVMHPADEFVAMAGLIDAGQPIEAVAARFGVSERHVKQRLRLGKVARELLDEFRAGTVTLEVMTAFTLGVDEESQLAVWRQVKTQPYVTAHAVRRLLTQRAVSVDSRLGAFVGLAACEAAGGTVRRDLFSTRDEGFMDDAALVRRLAIEKLEAKSQELRSSWAWARPMLDPDYGFTAEYRRVHRKPAPLPPEIGEELTRIERRLTELDNLAEDDWNAELAAKQSSSRNGARNSPARRMLRRSTRMKTAPPPDASLRSAIAAIFWSTRVSSNARAWMATSPPSRRSRTATAGER